MRRPGITIVDFWAPWCSPCKIVHAGIKEAAKKFSDTINIVRVDVDVMKDVAQKYDIMAVPTLLFFKDGKAVKRIIGYTSETEIEDMLRKIENGSDTL